MGFLVRIETVQRVSEYKGTTKDGNEYCIASWKVKNVVDNSVMLVSCFTKEDDILKSYPGVAMDGTLTIVCRDWSKDGRSGSMNNVNLTNIIEPLSGPSTQQSNETASQAFSTPNNVFNPAEHTDDLPF